MRKLIIVLFMSIFLISLASAQNVCGNDNSFLGGFDLNQNITLKQPCDSCSFVNLSSVTYPNSTVQNLNIQMIKNGISYTTSFAGTDNFGCYSYSVLGDKGGTNTEETLYFLIGEELTDGRAISYIGFIIILISAFLLTIFGAFKVRWKHQKSDEGKILTINHFRYVKIFLFTIGYFELMFLFGLSYKLFNEANITGFTQFFNFVYQLFLNLIFPLMVFLIITVFAIWINNKKLQKKIKLGI